MNNKILAFIFFTLTVVMGVLKIFIIQFVFFCLFMWALKKMADDIKKMRIEKALLIEKNIKDEPITNTKYLTEYETVHQWIEEYSNNFTSENNKLSCFEGLQALRKIAFIDSTPSHKEKVFLYFSKRELALRLLNSRCAINKFPESEYEELSKLLESYLSSPTRKLCDILDYIDLQNEIKNTLKL